MEWLRYPPTMTWVGGACSCNPCGALVVGPVTGGSPPVGLVPFGIPVGPVFGRVPRLGPPSFLLFSQKSSISRLGLNADDSPDIMLPIQGLKNIRALEFDPVADFLYWIDGKSHVIRRSRDNGTQELYCGEDWDQVPFHPHLSCPTPP
ncbi:hypothetical protein HPB52_018220 [Rhipicephalus sanguineus]|uniref:Uncharacterized protein n=1 Tax=Rhipicephalus sanguineus TaxID=34632 RepID=A0A9D4Q7Z8_RHISA|nr:hypothetical protein HPB52_018220 [Rhipicephalus sanguineus]